MIKKMTFAGLFALVFAINIFASEKISMAVYNFDVSQVQPETGSSVADFIQTALYRTGRFNIVERKSIEKILKEQAFQKTGCTSTDCAVEVGKILNVNNIITGSVAKTGQMYIISIRLVDVETSSIISMEKIETDSEDLLSPAATKLADHFSKTVAVKGKVLKITDDNEIIINIGSKDGAEKGQELDIERLGEAVKDETGTVVYQKKKTVAKIRVEDVSPVASSVKILSKTEDVKIGDSIEIKNEQTQPLEPLLKAKEAVTAKENQPSGMPGRFYVGAAAGYGSHQILTQNFLTHLGTVQSHVLAVVEAGGNLLGGNATWLVDVYGGAKYTLSQPISDMNGNEVSGSSIGDISFYAGLKFYPFTTLINPDYLKAKTWNEVRGIFAPYIGVNPALVARIFNFGTLTPADYSAVGGPVFLCPVKFGVDIANLFYIEVFTTIDQHITETLSYRKMTYGPDINYNLLYDQAGILIGARF